MQRILLFILTGFSLFFKTSYSQVVNLQGWHLSDAVTDGYHGISISNAYHFLKGKKSNTVIVAVIDTGVDTTQEDLKNILWRNPKEIAGNGIDDDGNGYVDDVYGWNFLGGKDGRNLLAESFEACRVYHKYKSKYLRQVDIDTMCSQTKEEYALWKKASKKLEIKPEEQVDLMFLEMAYRSARKNEKVLREEMKKDEFTCQAVEKFEPASIRARQAKLGYLTFLKITQFEPEETNQTIFAQLDEYITEKKQAETAKEIAPQNLRAEIVGDNYYDINDRFYGNSDVMGPSPLHGTHVSGIIGAQRNNGLGIDGVADNVRIMVIRALPEGDEYDKDIALAIRYAVDNGAKVINMSFGKGFSPEKNWVDEAVRYAEIKDVVIVHAAGNESENMDETNNYPNPQLLEFNRKANNFLNVGASGDPKINGGLVADFSNYGKNTVDVFAPGVKIYSTLPGNARYGFLKGTSMASPVVAGLAALIRSYYPELSAKQVVYAIENSVNKLDTALLVLRPGSSATKVKCEELSISGGFVNAFNAIKFAASLVPEKKKELEKPKPVLPKSSFKNAKIAR